MLAPCGASRDVFIRLVSSHRSLGVACPDDLVMISGQAAWVAFWNAEKQPVHELPVGYNYRGGQLRDHERCWGH
eukprot:5481351-Prymnesium_polylepis.2